MSIEVNRSLPATSRINGEGSKHTFGLRIRCLLKNITHSDPGIGILFELEDHHISIRYVSGCGRRLRLLLSMSAGLVFARESQCQFGIPEPVGERERRCARMGIYQNNEGLLIESSKRKKKERKRKTKTLPRRLCLQRRLGQSCPAPVQKQTSRKDWQLCPISRSSPENTNVKMDD